MTSVQNVLNVNEAYELTLQKASLPEPSAPKVAVLICRDDCIDLLVFSELEGQARIIPKVGNQTADALGALTSSGVLPSISAIMVIHHTAWDMLTSCNEEQPRKVKQELSAHASNVGSLHFRDLERAVRDDVAFLRASPLILKDTEITGLIYDVRSGNLSLVTSSCFG